MPPNHEPPLIRDVACCAVSTLSILYCTVGKDGLLTGLSCAAFAVACCTAIELGIILAELVSNCFKHAFPYSMGGHIEITVRRVQDDLYRLLVKDNGIGMDRTAQGGAISVHLGLEIVEALAEQLEGVPPGLPRGLVVACQLVARDVRGHAANAGSARCSTPSRTCVMTCFGVSPPPSSPVLSTMKPCRPSYHSGQCRRRTCECSIAGVCAGTSRSTRRIRLAVRTRRCNS